MSDMTEGGKKRTAPSGFCAGVVVALIVAGVLAVAVMDYGMRSIAPIVTVSDSGNGISTHSDTPVEPQPSDKVKIVDWNWAHSGSGGNIDSYNVSGKVKNLTAQPLKWVEFEVVIYDKKGCVCNSSCSVLAENVPALGTAAIQGHVLAYGGKPVKASLRVSSTLE